VSRCRHRPDYRSAALALQPPGISLSSSAGGPPTLLAAEPPGCAWRMVQARRTSVPLPNRCCARPSSICFSSRSAAAAPAAGSPPYSSGSSTRRPGRPEQRLRRARRGRPARLFWAGVDRTTAGTGSVTGAWMAQLPREAAGCLTERWAGSACKLAPSCCMSFTAAAVLVCAHKSQGVRRKHHLACKDMQRGHLPSGGRLGSATGQWSPACTRRLRRTPAYGSAAVANPPSLPGACSQQQRQQQRQRQQQQQQPHDAAQRPAMP